MPEAGVTESLRFYANNSDCQPSPALRRLFAIFKRGKSLESFTLELLKREYVSRQETS